MIFQCTVLFPMSHACCLSPFGLNSSYKMCSLSSFELLPQTVPVRQKNKNTTSTFTINKYRKICGYF